MMQMVQNKYKPVRIIIDNEAAMTMVKYREDIQLGIVGNH